MVHGRQDVTILHRWHVYIVRCADGSLYTGVTNNLALRLAAHNNGTGAKYTRGRLPVALVYAEAAANRSAAQRRERAIKKMRVALKRKLVAAAGSMPY